MIIGKARSCVADIYGLRDIEYDFERLSKVEHLLRQDRFLWHETERDLEYEVCPELVLRRGQSLMQSKPRT